MRAVFHEMEEEVNRRVMEIDFFSPCILTKKVLPGLSINKLECVYCILGKFDMDLLNLSH